MLTHSKLSTQNPILKHGSWPSLRNLPCNGEIPSYLVTYQGIYPMVELLPRMLKMDEEKIHVICSSWGAGCFGT